MKTSLLLVAAIALFGAIDCFAVTNVEQTTSVVLKNLPRLEFYKQINDAVADGGTDVSNLVFAVDELLRPQSDGNSTTTNSLFTPRRIGDLLTGQNLGTNVVFMSIGVTTNDWLESAR